MRNLHLIIDNLVDFCYTLYIQGVTILDFVYIHEKRTSFSALVLFLFFSFHGFFFLLLLCIDFRWNILNCFSDFLCMYCNKTLPICTDEIVLHTKTCAAIQRPDNSHRFVCCFCGYKTDRISNMKPHVRCHTGEKPFKCPYCSHQCAQSQSLKSHIQIRHSGFDGVLTH